MRCAVQLMILGKLWCLSLVLQWLSTWMWEAINVFSLKTFCLVSLHVMYPCHVISHFCVISGRIHLYRVMTLILTQSGESVRVHAMAAGNISVMCVTDLLLSYYYEA